MFSAYYHYFVAGYRENKSLFWHACLQTLYIWSMGMVEGKLLFTCDDELYSHFIIIVQYTYAGISIGRRNFDD
jgi:hypothetical protein